MLALPPQKRSYKIYFVLALGVIGLTSLVLCALFIIQNPGWGNPARLTASSVFVPKDISQESAALESSRLKIPKIKVDTTIDSVGIMGDGTMEAPADGQKVGWFKFGPQPGQPGSAVLAGHYGRWKDGEQSVFDDLNQLEKGDRVYVESKEGVITTFIVRESRIYEPRADATAVFTSNDTKTHLNLITCQGTWDKARKSYTERLVVFTDAITDR